MRYHKIVGSDGGHFVILTARGTSAGMLAVYEVDPGGLWDDRSEVIYASANAIATLEAALGDFICDPADKFPGGE